jgi:hypothetical protein
MDPSIELASTTIVDDSLLPGKLLLRLGNRALIS